MTTPTQSPPLIRETSEDMDKNRCSTTSDQTKQPSVVRFTPAPWIVQRDEPSDCLYLVAGAWPFGSTICEIEDKPREGSREANARLLAAAPDLFEAAALLDAAEDAHANCPECDGEIMPELCERCFPLFDDARLKRRAALAKAAPQTGE